MSFQSILDKLYSWQTYAFQGIFAKILGSIITLLMGFIIGRIVGKFVQEALNELEANEFLKKLKIKRDIESGAGSLLSYSIYLASIIIALNIIGLTSIVLYIIVVLLVILIFLSTVLATKDSLPNIFARFFSLRKRGLEKGKILQYKNIEGKIVRKGILEVKIKTKKGDVLFVPNSTLANGRFKVLSDYSKK